MSRVHSHDDVFADRNAFLQVTLGAISLCRGLADLTLGLGPAAAETPPRAIEADRFLDAVLGIASLWNLTVQGLERSVGIPDAKPSEPPSDAEPLFSELRSLLA